jgi:hypothetical protein
MATLIRCRVLQPFSHKGELLYPGAPVLLEPREAEKLAQWGRVEVVRERGQWPARWCEPHTR